MSLPYPLRTINKQSGLKEGLTEEEFTKDVGKGTSKGWSITLRDWPQKETLTLKPKGAGGKSLFLKPRRGPPSEAVAMGRIQAFQDLGLAGTEEEESTSCCFSLQLIPSLAEFQKSSMRMRVHMGGLPGVQSRVGRVKGWLGGGQIENSTIPVFPIDNMKM